MWTLISLGGRLTKSFLVAAMTLCRKRISVGSVLVALALGYGAWELYKTTRDKEELVGWTKTINDSTKAVIAAPSKHDLTPLTDAAKSIHGSLVAGVSIKTKPETLFVPIKEVIQSTVKPDSSREATLQDTTAGYQIRITAIAPPFPQPLKLGYSFVTPAFHPEVGFVKVGNSYAATVSWGGKQFEIADAFFLPVERRIPSLTLTGHVGVESVVGNNVMRAPVVALQLTKVFSSHSGLSFQAANVAGESRLQLTFTRQLWSR